MATHKHSSVNPLINPVTDGDIIIAESGERYIVRQTMSGDYWLRHVDGHDITHPVSGQINICAVIDGLANL